MRVFVCVNASAVLATIETTIKHSYKRISAHFPRPRMHNNSIARAIVSVQSMHAFVLAHTTRTAALTCSQYAPSRRESVPMQLGAHVDSMQLST